MYVIEISACGCECDVCVSVCESICGICRDIYIHTGSWVYIV